MARGMVEMSIEINNSLYDSVIRTNDNSTPTKFHQWYDEVLINNKPIINKPIIQLHNMEIQLICIYLTNKPF